MRRLYGPMPASQFGPLALKAVRQAMIDEGWCRTYVNAQVSRVRRFFAWAVENEMVPATVHHALQAVAGFRVGECTARESEPVKPVPGAHVDAIKDHVSEQVWAMIQLQRLTGMEVYAMRTGDIDTTGKLWTYRPATHKTMHRGHDRTIFLGEPCKRVLEPFLKPYPRRSSFPRQMRKTSDGAGSTSNVRRRSLAVTDRAATE